VLLNGSLPQEGVFAPRQQADQGTGANSALRAAYRLSAVIAVLMLAASAAGLWIDRLYQDPTSVSAMLRGGDLVTLVVAAPALVAALLLAIRGSQRAKLVWVGMLVYSVYNYAVYVFGAAFNDLFLLHVALFSLSIFALVLALGTSTSPASARSSPRARRCGGSADSCC